MTTAGMSSGSVGAVGDLSFIATAGVAALDTPQLSQTKIEIRTLVAEVAALSTADVDCKTFMHEMLPRVCTAMGATAAAVWELSCDQVVTLSASHKLPALLHETGRDESRAHEHILGCVAAEGGPILVPPRSIKVAAERPANPLDEALLIVPIRIHDRVDMLLEVIQPGSGGPAAQRGYLRFVAQMADLLADFVRRWRLRSLNANSIYVQRLQEHLLSVGSEPSPKQRFHLVAKALARLLQADMVLVLQQRTSRWHVHGISELSTFDPRSEIVVAAEKVLSKSAGANRSDVDSIELLADLISPLDASSTSEDLKAEAPSEKHPSESSQSVLHDTRDAKRSPRQSEAADNLCRMLGCSYLFRLSLDASGACQVLLAAHGSIDQALLQERATELARAFGALLASRERDHRWFGWLHPTSVKQPLAAADKKLNVKRWQVERWIVRCSTVLLVAAVALFPTPDQLGVIAVLEAVNKEQYYAPVSASIETVFVDSDQPVRKGEPLVDLVDRQLEARVDELTSERLTCASQLEQDRAALLRGQQLTPGQRDDLESRIEQLKINLRSLDEQLNVVHMQAAHLHVTARHHAVVTTWDARNRLQGRPVAAGQLLLTTCAPDADWQLRLSVPERQAGRINDALALSPTGIPVRFSLSSHPTDVRTGRLVSLSKQLLKGEDGTSKFIGLVAIDTASLPARTDGAVARAAIDCGRSWAVWLLVRDVYQEAKTWLRLTW
jgi:hypothetical protein